jgi:hypothetical protein
MKHYMPGWREFLSNVFSCAKVTQSIHERLFHKQHVYTKMHYLKERKNDGASPVIYLDCFMKLIRGGWKRRSPAVQENLKIN